MVGRKRKERPKWRYDFNCRKCDNIQFINDPKKGRLGDYCVACVDAFDQGRPNPIHADGDRVIRIADLCGYLGIDLDAVIAEKMAYNADRPYKHGKQF